MKAGQVTRPKAPPQAVLHQQRTFFNCRADDLLLLDAPIVIPRDLQLETLHRLHEGHLGISKYRALALISVWWSNLSNQMEEMVNKCQPFRPDITTSTLGCTRSHMVQSRDGFV